MRPPRYTASEEREVFASVERLPTFRSFDGYAMFSCPACGRRGHTRGRAVWCEGGCSVASIDRTARSVARPSPTVRSTEARGSSWPTAEFELARLRARAEAEARFAEELAGPDDAWTPSLLTSADPVPEPTILRVGNGAYLLRRGEIALVCGLPGAAKTPLAYLGVVDVVQRGEVAMIVDYEMGKRKAVALLRELGLTTVQIQRQVIYFDNPPPLTEMTRARVVEVAAGLDVSYVLIDALADSMPSGASQNDAADVNAWFASTPKWFAKQFDAAVLVIDHTNKGDGPDPGGSVRKQGVPDLRMWLRGDTGFSKSHEDGCSTLIVRRDKNGTYAKGDVVAELRNELHEGGSRFVLREPGSSPVASGDDLDLDLGAMSPSLAAEVDALERLRKKATWVLTKDVTGDGGADSQRLRKALNRLQDKGSVVSRRDPGSAKGQLWCAVEFAVGDSDE